MTWVSAQDLADMRAVTAQQTLPETCAIVRGGVQIATPRCRVSEEPVQVSVVSADRLQPARRWTIRLPYGTDVHRGDVVEAMGEQYAVVEEESPHSYAVTTRVICLRQGAVTDDTGTPGVDEATDDLIHANATVTLQRFAFDPTSKHTSLHAAGQPFPARVDDLSTQYAAEGEGPSFAIQITCAGSVDIRDGDVVASIDPPLATLPSYAQVRHVEIKRVNAGLTYKVATVTELPQGGSAS